MYRMRVIVSAVGMVATLAGAAQAQWFRYPTAAIPRTADGRPNLGAGAPRTKRGVDFSGIWRKVQSGRIVLKPADGGELPFTDAGAALYRERRESNQRDLPSGRCLPHGAPLALWVPAPFKIVHTTGLTLMLFEEFKQYRQIFTDGRPFTGETDPTAWFGYSTARWERETFVVDTQGLTAQSWLDPEGLPHSEQAKLREVYRRPTFGRMQMQLTIEDPVMFTRRWTAMPVEFSLLADTELMEYVCENEKDREHLVGK